MDYSKLPRRNIIVIDMKSFFASCECVERGLDPFKTPLVVADPNRNGAITLAVTPYLKKLGVPSRCRIYEIPKNIKYITAPPRMNLYLKRSQDVVNIFKEFVSEEDMHVYSVDESFLDVTDYLSMYGMDDYNLAKKIMKTIKDRLGLTSTAGIGPNMLIAKVAMDIEAKHTKDNIAKWDYKDIKEKFSPITPLSKFWGIGKRMERNLNAMGLNTIGDVAKYPRQKLVDKFGVMGKELWEHTNGIDLSRISDFNIPRKDKSYSQSQVLFKDYNEDNIQIIIKEVIDNEVARLRKNKKKATVIGLGIKYSKVYGGGFYRSRRIPHSTNDVKEIYSVCYGLFQRFYEDFPIRVVTINLGGLVDDNAEQLSLFESYESKVKNDKIDNTVDEIKEKYGKNSIIRASNLLKDSTAIERNKKIRGNRA